MGELLIGVDVSCHLDRQMKLLQRVLNAFQCDLAHGSVSDSVELTLGTGHLARFVD